MRSWSPATRRAWIESLPPAELRRFAAESWLMKARPEQLPPDGDWKTWLFLGGRGAGKTRAGAEWLLDQARVKARLALVGPTLHDVREVMIEGPSGLLAMAPKAARPTFQSSRRKLTFKSGAVAYAFSAEDPESLRGPQFHAAWADEFCAWPRGLETLAQLRLGLRLGDAPRLAVTTTPKPSAALRKLMAEPGLALTRAGTEANAANLAPDFVADLLSLYGGTRLAAQELEGQVVEPEGGALWRADELARARGPGLPAYDQVVVAVDPPASDHGDACGLIAAARKGERAYVLADASAGGLSPLAWAGRAAALAVRWGAQLVVAEANQGGEMVRSLLALAGCEAPVRLLYAGLGKRARAEPVAALYEQGRVTHAGAFPTLEEELMALGQMEVGPRKSPDRADALVWALTVLLLEGRAAPPRLRVL